jgi:glycosyltransferase involved in cell wall biosynthesis
MKIALVHELLTIKGGAERVLRVLTDMYPDAPIYTLLYDEKKLGDWFPASKVKVALRPTRGFNHHLYLSKFPAAVESWDFSGYDAVISSSSAFAHGIITNGNPKHLCYVHSPARYLWDRTHDVQQQAGKGLLGALKKWHLSRTFHPLRVWDSEAADRPDVLLAASKEVQRRIELYWRRGSSVLYPPIDDMWLQPASRPAGAMEHPDYFLVVSTLARYKRIDVTIDACNRLGMHLKIVGQGPDAGRLKRMAGPTVEFYGWREGDELKDLYANAKATLFPGDEDFGLVPLESMACGTPVIGFAKGGALESILPGKTGELFAEPTAESLAAVMKTFDPKKYSKSDCVNQARRFDRKTFEAGIREAVERMMK